MSRGKQNTPASNILYGRTRARKGNTPRAATFTLISFEWTHPDFTPDANSLKLDDGYFRGVPAGVGDKFSGGRDWGVMSEQLPDEWLGSQTVKRIAAQDGLLIYEDMHPRIGEDRYGIDTTFSSPRFDIHQQCWIADALWNDGKQFSFSFNATLAAAIMQKADLHIPGFWKTWNETITQEPTFILTYHNISGQCHGFMRAIDT